MFYLEVSFLFCLCVIMVLLGVSTLTLVAFLLSLEEQLFLRILRRAITLGFPGLPSTQVVIGPSLVC